ncbi:tRNA (guanine-N(7)-)-methyltransferase non-catalytic subunit WDR4 [Melanaphis sacchari]|uniref:tRNA (guanine-N(7)-)-methyltransferase non-catalytic subunit WDR4 n=1 Tax=Melanaphis sacchari TaxID=742174 RepID=UPI000DC15450|nr:tRNA (guanine-N(7)-)-methyltransferase non-catalytic subunit WDR4 [Melanaphis sacchari]
MTCIAVSRTTVVVSSIDVDKCFVYSLDSGNVKNLTENLGEAYKNIPINNHDLQKACAAFSADGTLFAYNPNKGKLLSIWNTTNWTLVENKSLAKHATNIVFTPKTNVIVVGDKKGDVYAFEELPIRILGHSSMILDICISDNEKYIVTCDNDEKVRVSHYPNGKNIVYYMMGHEAYVSGICLLNNFILSGSGDCTLRLWDFNNGDLIDKLTLHTAVQNVIEIENLAAIQLYNSKDVHIIKTEKKENKWNIKNIKTLKFENNVLNLAAHGNQLWILTSNSVYKYTIDACNESILRNEDVEMTHVFETLSNLVKSFIYLEKTNLMTFLYNKMIDKQIRTEQYKNKSSSPVLHQIKKIRTGVYL